MGEFALPSKGKAFLTLLISFTQGRSMAFSAIPEASFRLEGPFLTFATKDDIEIRINPLAVESIVMARHKTEAEAAEFASLMMPPQGFPATATGKGVCNGRVEGKESKESKGHNGDSGHNGV